MGVWKAKIFATIYTLLFLGFALFWYSIIPPFTNNEMLKFFNYVALTGFMNLAFFLSMFFVWGWTLRKE